MKKILIAGMGALLVGLALSNTAFSDPNAYRVAVVDVQQVVQSSAQVNQLKADQQAKANDLKTFVQTAQAALAKEPDETKRKALEDSYNKQLNDKRAAMEKDYTTKLAAIDKSITGIISAQAKADKYDLVLAKGIVIYGGTDITETVKKNIK